jgi:hypothetical protein
MCDALMPPMPCEALIAICDSSRPEPHRGFVPSYPAATFGTYAFGVPVESMLSSAAKGLPGPPPWAPGPPPWVSHHPHTNLPEPDLAAAAVVAGLWYLAARKHRR